MLRFERDVLIADLAERTIEGVIVPFDEVGTIAGRDYRFRRGSIELGSRVPLLVDHDRGHPIGVLAELVDQPTGVLARFKIDETPAGDEALVQAASGSRGALSIGAEVIRSRLARDGVVDVEASAVAEVSLLALGAFNGASVTRVAAEQDPPAEPLEPAEPIETDPEQPELEPEPDTEPAPPADPEEGEPMEASHAAPVIRAERSPSPRDLRAGELVRFIIEAQHGNREAARYLEAALTESDHTDVSGLLPPTFERTVIGGKTTLRPLFDAFASRPLPGVGLMVSKPKWTTRPDGAWAADVSADATSSAGTGPARSPGSSSSAPTRPSSTRSMPRPSKTSMSTSRRRSPASSSPARLAWRRNSARRSRRFSPRAATSARRSSSSWLPTSGATSPTSARSPSRSLRAASASSRRRSPASPR